MLVEDDIEHPMQFVLDATMGAHDAQQPLGGNIGEQEITHLGRLRAGMTPPPSAALEQRQQVKTR